MKILFLFLGIASFTFSQNLYIKGGVDVSTNLTLSTRLTDFNLNTTDKLNIYTVPGIHFESLFNYPIAENTNIGLGIRYESEPREQTIFESVGFNTVPVFLSLQYKFLNFNAFDFRTVGRIGYTMVGVTREIFADFEEQNGGIYYGFGLVLEEKDPSSLIWEILFSVSHTSFENEIGFREIEHDYQYSKISLTIGKRFSF